MRAIILAGGKGVRLRPYTVILPKPLVPINGELPILEIVIIQLKKSGFNHITIAVNYLANLIMAYFGNGDKWNVKIDYSIEDTPLSTIGPLTLIRDLPKTFLVMNGDILTNINYKILMNNHTENKYDVTVATCVRKQKIDFGVLETNKDNLIIGFEEKPEYSFLVSMGIYVINRTVIEKLKPGENYGFDDLMHQGVLNHNKFFTYHFDGYWLDIGRPDDYSQANEDFVKMRDKLL